MSVPLSDLDRRILSTLGERISLNIDGSEAWATGVLRSSWWIARRAGLQLDDALEQRLLSFFDHGLIAVVDQGEARLWRLAPAGCEALAVKSVGAPMSSDPELAEVRAAVIATGEILVSLLTNLELGGAHRWELGRHLETLRAREGERAGGVRQ